MTVAVYGRQKVNVALNRSSFMSSTFTDTRWGQHSKERANDGNNDPVALQQSNSCIVTEMEADPWWVVDLGVPLAVVGVLFTNRAEGDGNVLELSLIHI